MPTPRTRVTQGDLEFFPSERLTDNDDGGGMPLGTPIKGEANELFDPISSIARVNGGFYARLVYAGVMRPDDEPLIGAHVALTRPPDDPSVSYLLFKATKFGELRREILKRIEAYSVGTIESRMTLLSTQSQNSKIIQAYQRVDEPLPTVGDVFCLRQDKKGYPWAEQYVQVIRVESANRKFTNPQTGKEFERTVVKMELSSKLNTDYLGVDYPVEGYADAPCKLRETHVADAAQYYGIKPLSEAITANTTQIKIPTLMEKLVPTNQIETALIDLTAAGQRQTLLDAGRTGADGVVSLTVNRQHATGTISTIHLGNAALPSSIVIDTNPAITDKGGTLYQGDKAVGNADYARGLLTLTDPALNVYIGSVRFRPAAADLQVADTLRLPVTINNRSYEWTANITPPPAVGSVMVSYRAQGRWYDLRDDGTGALRGASPAHGSGNINPITGSLNVSCGELPDVGSSIIVSWGTQARYFNRSGSNATAKLLLTLAQDADPATIRLVWNDSNGTKADKTAQSDASGVITGNWTGTYDASTRQIRIDTGANFAHPEGVLDVKVTYAKGEKKTVSKPMPSADADGNVTVVLGDAPILPRSLDVRWSVSRYGYGNGQTVQMTDDGAGKLIVNGTQVGTVDYTARKLTFKSAITTQALMPIYQAEPVYRSATAPIGSAGSEGGGGFMYSPRTFVTGYEYRDVVATPVPDATLEVRYYDTAPSTTVTETLPSSTIEIDLLPTNAEVVAPSSVLVAWGAKRYFDRLGSVYADLNPTTGAASLAGNIDYANAKMMIDNWQWTTGAAPSVIALVTSVTGNPVDAVTFRTPSSPIRAGSLQLRATAVDGTVISVRADVAGVINSPTAKGNVDAEYGVGDVRFGKLVTVTDAIKTQPWYSDDAVQNGKIWQPIHVFAESITYNTVAYSYLPIDSTAVKIDTVRLPQDGRIPIFRRGDNILIGNRQMQDIGSAHAGGQTVTLTRGNLDRICVTDADGVHVNAELWDYDLDAGSITWRTPLDLSSYKMPLSVMHAQEERNRILQADIDGTLSLIFPTKRAYPIDNTYVSSILKEDTLQVRMSVPFTQRNWDNVWRDVPNGEQLLNRLNVKDYPAILTDDGAITERWMIQFTSANQFELYGETLGFVRRADTLTDLAPINPATKKPYFNIPKEAFGADAPWATKDVIRFDTWGSLMSVWVLCAVQPSPTAWKEEDGYTMCLFGDTTELQG